MGLGHVTVQVGSQNGAEAQLEQLIVDGGQWWLGLGCILSHAAGASVLGKISHFSLHTLFGAKIKPNGGAILEPAPLLMFYLFDRHGVAMEIAANLAVALVALLHLYFLVLEMFLWNRPFGWKTFGLTPEFAAASSALAANQGLYNGFLAAGLVWGLVSGGREIQVFFLACVIVAGVFGAATVGRKILYVQALPGAVALLLVVLR